MKTNYWKCKNCTKLFFRYPYGTRNSKPTFCSRICKGLWQKTASLGDKNPNYKSGIHVNPVCNCGKEKDYRSKMCAECDGRSFIIGSKYDDKIDKNLLILTAETSKSIKEVAQKLEVKRTTASKYIKKFNINLDHFTPSKNRLLSIDKVLILGNKPRHGTVKKVILRNELLKYECQKCKNFGKWLDECLSLELDHINGNNKDNRLENLRFLCPNCHSQTNTYCGRNQKGIKNGSRKRK